MQFVIPQNVQSFNLDEERITIKGGTNEGYVLSCPLFSQPQYIRVSFINHHEPKEGQP